MGQQNKKYSAADKRNIEGSGGAQPAKQGKERIALAEGLKIEAQPAKQGKET